MEINPLGVDEAGRVMALDGKITVNDRAIARHSDLLALRAEADPAASLVVPCWLDSSAAGGGIGIICNSGALALATGDALAQAQQPPMACYLVGISPQGQRLEASQLLAQLDATLYQRSPLGS
ncbi:MAG: hypothetical protein HC890_18975 [Chloroflexaceae bacterium]|nr:hypothetical protein [Chloroflexaceae bacterium]